MNDEKKQIRQFLMNLSTELKTPLFSIVGYADILLKGVDGSLAEEQKIDVNWILNNGQQTIRLIDSLEDVALLLTEPDELELDLGEVDLKRVVKTAVNEFVGRDEIEIEENISQNLPNVWADYHRVEQIITKIILAISNKAKKDRFTFTSYYDEDWVSLKIIGPKLPVAKYFAERFIEQFNKAEDAYNLGDFFSPLWGLRVSQHLVKVHNGKMCIEKQEGENSVILFSLPCLSRK